MSEQGTIHTVHSHLLGTMNQLANVHNRHQTSHKRVLFLCSAGLLRSATAAHVFGGEPYNWNTRTAGVVPEYALNPVSVALLDWADHVFLMNEDNEWDLKHLLGTKLYDQFANKINVLNVPDRYPYRHPDLVKALIEQVQVYLPS